MKFVTYKHFDCVELSSGPFQILATINVGPRIISLRVNGGENLFAELFDETLASGSYHLYGGHRLWYAPEDAKRTYIPDDDPVEVKEIEHGVQLVQTIEEETGIQKEMKIQLGEENAHVDVEHILRNLSNDPVTLAPWAITMFKPGGVALLPQNTGRTQDNELRPNRAIALWPYTDIHSPFIKWGNEFVLIRSNLHEGQLKIGYPNMDGWMAYWRGETLFIKRSEYVPHKRYYDFESSSECYCAPEYIELETLGPITELPPGESTSHKEIWETHQIIEWTGNVSDLGELSIGEERED